MKIKSFLIVFFMSTLMNILYAQDSDRTFPVSDKVTVERVRFKNRFGITLAADLYKPKQAEGKLPAIAVSGPFGQSKNSHQGFMRKQWLNVDSWLLLSILPIRVKAVVNLAMLPLRH